MPFSMIVLEFLLNSLYLSSKFSLLK